MICPFCHNSDETTFFTFNGKVVCRKCIHLKKQEPFTQNLPSISIPIKAQISYNLTPTQKKASEEILYHVKNNDNVLVHAVCGAGKTELVYQVMEYILNRNGRIAFAIPRKDVVIEIYGRLKKDFPMILCTSVYGGHNTNVNGQIIVLTTHQLYRFPHFFDLLILDEADAFPYYQNELLQHFLMTSCKGPIVYLSATIQEYDNNISIVEVNRRFHNHDLPIPQYIHYFSFNKISILKKVLSVIGKEKKPCLIFVPTVALGKSLENILHLPFVYSSKKDKETIIKRFKCKEFLFLITTSILERGITIKDIQVIVYEANHNLYDVSSLIQISGRVGRKKSNPTGKIYFLATQCNERMKQCIKQLKEKNQNIV